jgi:hypothetical protein
MDALEGWNVNKDVSHRIKVWLVKSGATLVSCTPV